MSFVTWLHNATHLSGEEPKNTSGRQLEIPIWRGL